MKYFVASEAETKRAEAALRLTAAAAAATTTTTTTPTPPDINTKRPADVAAASQPTRKADETRE